MPATWMEGALNDYFYSLNGLVIHELRLNPDVPVWLPWLLWDIDDENNQ